MSFLDQVFGRKPDVPPLQPTDPLAELSTLLGGEIKDWPQIEELSNLYQNYMLGALDTAVPGFSDILKQGGVDAQALLQEALPLEKGQIPEDVAQQVTRSAAFQSLGAGTLGGPMGSALAARNLGLTSLDLMSQGANLATSGGNAAQRWAGIASGTILPPSANMYSPEWFSQFIAQQRASQQAIAQQRANVAAAPDPALQALNQWIEQVGGSIISSYAGGGMGGGKGASYMTGYNPGQYGIGGAQGGAGAGASFGGVNPYSATVGGFNISGSNFGGTPMPYMGGGSPTDTITNPGYASYGSSPYMTPFNQWQPDPAMPGGVY